MSDPSRTPSSKYHHPFCKTESSPGKNDILDFISSICDDDHIERLDNNTWKCLWCDIKFQVINAIKALGLVLGKIVISIKSCFTAINKAHLSKYKYLKNYISSKNSKFNYYFHKVISSVSHLQDD